MAKSFRENVVIITGASSGIGQEMAYQLAAQGAWLVLAARNEAKLEQAAAQCRQLGGKALVIPTDVTDEAQCRQLVEATVAAYGRVDTLINNAGISMWGKFEEMQSLAPFHNIMQINYFGSVYCTYYALPHLKKSQGRLVAISSLSGRTGVPTRSGYVASKHAITGFFDSLRIELAADNVSVTVIFPDFVASNIRNRSFGVDGKPLGHKPFDESKIMSAETCARLSLEAIGKRKRESIQTFRGKIGQWLKLIAPGVVDRIARNAIEKGK